MNLPNGLTLMRIFLVPLLVAGIVTLELCVALDLPLNFANILALPLLLGVGVAFKIYYIMAWRSGKTALVQSSLTRAVIFSAMATGTGFFMLIPAALLAWVLRAKKFRQKQLAK